MRWVAGLGVFVVALLVGTGSGVARTAQATVGVYPSGTSFTASGSAPSGATSSVSLAMPIGGVDDAELLVRGAQHVGIVATLGSPLQLKLLFAHYVSVGGTPTPDALEPWDGATRSTEQTNQPVWLQVTVPPGTSPGTYTGQVTVAADDTTTVVPVTVTVFNVKLPAIGATSGALLTAFNFSPQSYGAEVNKLYGITADQVLPGLFQFFSSYRLSPNNWGYGNPDARSGYTSSPKWWLDKAGEMVNAVGSTRQFGSMWIPVSSNRWPKSAYVGGLSPYAPQTWCSYLRSVHSFWDSHGWLDGSYPYLYGMDEPGAKLFPVVGQQAKTVHSCFPGGHVLVTGNPSSGNRFLWNGGSDDVDTWVVLASRYYGKYSNPQKKGRKQVSHATENLKTINAVRARGKQVWTYTYAAGSHSTPGFAATEPLSDPRMFVDWAALEGITGLLYGEGTTSYDNSNPLVTNDRLGAYVLVYPGRTGPIPSARLEEIREGIEDWEILNVVRQSKGRAEVTHLLSSLFSTTATGAQLACTVGCPLKSSTPYSWPIYSRDATTPGKIAAMRLAALTAAS